MDEISYSEYAVLDLLDAFASNQPVPGGGSAAGLAASLGVSLLMMVAGLPKTRSGQSVPEEAADLAEAESRLRLLREKLVPLIDRDSEAYRQVLSAMRLPRGSPEEQKARAEAIQTAMRGAAEVPLETMRLCQQALAGAVVVAKNGHLPAHSDLAVALELLVAAMRGCAINVDVNLKAVKDPSFTESMRTERRQLESDSLTDAERARALLVL